MVDPISEQYERYPYPLRSPDEDNQRVNQLAPLDDLKIIAHYGYRGRLDPDRTYRFLIAGGGTGDSVVHMGYQARLLGLNAEIIYLDLSKASRSVAEDRAQKMGLDNVHFVTGSLLELDHYDLGHFDYVNSCGVLHHLPDPAKGMQALGESLAPGGILGVMVYGKVGRTGLYPAQKMLRMMVGDQDLSQQIAFAREFLPNLPPTNWLNRNERLSYKAEICDAEIVDRYLHRRDRAYTVPDILALCADAEMSVLDFLPRMLYSPSVYTKNKAVLEKVKKMPRFDQYAMGELLGGVINKHGFFAIKKGDELAGSAAIEPHMVPEFLGVNHRALAQRLASGPVNMSIGGLSISLNMTLNPRVVTVCRYINGMRSLEDICLELSMDEGRKISWMEFKADFMHLYSTFNACSALVLKQPKEDQG